MANRSHAIMLPDLSRLWWWALLLSALSIAMPAHAADGQCGTANNQISVARPTRNLCVMGLPSLPSQKISTAPWLWTCKGTTPGAAIASCHAIAMKPTKLIVSKIPDPIAAVNNTKLVVRTGPIYLKSGDVLDGVRVSSTTGPACIIIYPDNKDIVIKNSVIGPCYDKGVPVAGIGGYERTTNIRITGNIIHDVSRGAFFYKSYHPIYFDHNYAYNILGPFPAGQMIQFHSVTTGTKGSKVNCNISDVQGSAIQSTEDHINMWLSNGLPGAERTEIAYNRIRGGMSKSGSGINPGDGGGGNVVVHDNTIVNQGNVGTGIASGQNIDIVNNRVYADGITSLSGVGIYVQNYYPGTACGNNIVNNNRTFSMNSAWYNPMIPEHYGANGTCPPTQLIGNVFGDKSLSANMFDEEYTQCK